MKRKAIIYVACIAILVAGYKVGDKILDKIYLSRYHIEDYTDSDRFKTVNKVVEARFNSAKDAVIVNTGSLDQGASATVLAYQMKAPVFYTEKFRIMNPVYSEMEKLGVKNVYLVGGVNSLSEPTTRSLDRNGYSYKRIAEDYPGISASIDIAKEIAKIKSFDKVAIVTRNEFDIPNAISFLPYACENNIPIIVMNNDEDDIRLLKNFLDEYKVNTGYIIGNDEFVNSNISKLFGKAIKIQGKDRYDVNLKIMDKLYSSSNNSRVYISKGGEILHKRHISPGQLVNALGIAPLAADNHAPLMYIQNNYFSTDEAKLIKSKGYTKIGEVGFKIERRNFFNVERFKGLTTILLILINVLIIIITLGRKRNKLKKDY